MSTTFQKMDSPSKRLLVSGSIMFLVFGLVFSCPPVYLNRDLFPGLRHMYTLHMEGTQNGLMLMVAGLMAPHLELSSTLTWTMEASMHVGAWMNVFPWLYGAITGCALNMGGDTVASLQRAAHEAQVPDHNDFHSSVMISMLTTCMIGDLLAWILVLHGLLVKHAGASKVAKQEKRH